MLLKITFNRALIISFLWHFLCFFAVTIIILPVGVREGGFSEISFLGPILDKTSFREEFRDRRLYQKGINSVSSRLFTIDAEDRRLNRLKTYTEKDYFLKERPYAISIDEIVESEKRLPATEKDEPVLLQSNKGYNIEGEAKGRAVLFKPHLPEYLHSAQEGSFGKYHMIKLKVIITPDGSVEDVEKLQSSGLPGLDLFSMRYVKKWSFAALPPDVMQKNQESIIILMLKSD